MRFWRRKRVEEAREGWVALYDAEGRQVSESIAVTVRGDPLNFHVTNSLTFSQIEGSTVTTVRVTDIDGNVREVPIGGAGLI